MVCNEVGKRDMDSDRDGKSVISDTESEQNVNAYVTVAKEAAVPINSTIAKRHGSGTRPRTTDQVSASDQVLSINEWLHVLRKPTRYLTSLTIESGHGEEHYNGNITDKKKRCKLLLRK